MWLRTSGCIEKCLSILRLQRLLNKMRFKEVCVSFVKAFVCFKIQKLKQQKDEARIIQSFLTVSSLSSQIFNNFNPERRAVNKYLTTQIRYILPMIIQLITYLHRIALEA
jgi:hypothetical protein